MKITDKEFYLIHHFKEEHATIKKISEKLKIPESTVRHVSKRSTPPSQAQRKQKKLAAAKQEQINRRRKLVLGLVNKKTVVVRRRYTPKLRKPRERKIVIREYGSLAAIKSGLQRLNNVKVSKSTVRNDLRSLGKRARRTRMGPYLTAEQKTKRVNFAKQSRNTVFDFSDECMISANASQKGWQWIGADEIPDTVPQEKEAHQLLVWGVIGKGGFRKLIIFDGKERLTKVTYQNKVLSKVVDQLKERTKKGFTFQSDGATPHKGTFAYLKRRGVRFCRTWPAKSCDMSPIETVWSLLKRKVQAKCPFGVEELKKAIEGSWDEITDASIDKLIDSFRYRCEAVVKCGGAVIKPQKPQVAKANHTSLNRRLTKKSA